MAVKCNIPNLTLKSVHSILYGFSCDNVTQKIVQNYLEYLKCPGVDYSFCDDFPCVAPGGDVFCFIDDVNLTLVSVTINEAQVSFTIPSQPYSVTLIKVSDESIIDVKQNPTSPINYTGLLPATNFISRFTLLCEGGEIKIENLPILTMPVCVEVEDIEGIAEDVNEYI